jgi:hypothetical protein
MKWMKERDLLIAQTMAFVQSVTGKKPDAEKSAAAPVELAPDVETATFDAMERAIAIVEPPKAEKPKAVEMPRTDLQNEYRSEIQSRVASFRAHQERISREREAYCSATLAKIHATIGRDGTPLRK